MTDPQQPPAAKDLKAEVARLRAICRQLDRMGEGERGRALRWIASKYKREAAACGWRGEP